MDGGRGRYMSCMLLLLTFCSLKVIQTDAAVPCREALLKGSDLPDGIGGFYRIQRARLNGNVFYKHELLKMYIFRNNSADLFSLNFQSFEVVSLYFDTQLQVTENARCGCGARKWVVGPDIHSREGRVVSYEWTRNPIELISWHVSDINGYREAHDIQLICLDEDNNITESTNQTNPICGLRPPSPTPSPGVPEQYIANSHVAEIGAWPWTVALLRSDGEVMCGGTLIGSKWVVTAAHCLTGNNFTVRVGAHNVDIPELTSSDYGAKQTYIVPDFVSTTRPFVLTGDLALVELNDDVTYSDHVQPACLPQPPESDGIPLADKYTNCYIVGWGKTFETDAVGGSLQQLGVASMIDKVECQTSYFRFSWLSESNTLCLFPTNRGKICIGDSGSPLVCQREGAGAWTVVGLASWTVTLCVGTNGRLPSVYTDVSHYVTWIEDIIYANR